MASLLTPTMAMSPSVSGYRYLVPSPQVVQPIERVLASRSDIKVGLIDKRDFGHRHVSGCGVAVDVGGSDYRLIGTAV